MSKLCLGCTARYDDEYNICPACGYAENTPVADTMHMEPGSKLQDRYIVGRALGNGGFGVTYIGWDTLIERPVAIKEYLPPEFSTRGPGQTKVTVYTGDKSEQFTDGLSKFIDESQRLAKFTNTDGIVNIYDSFEENNTAYIVMELLKGETLAERLKRQDKIPVEEALEILLPIIQSLETVHEKGIVHRDIAPDNIFLTDNGAKLIDFGAARFATTKHSRSLNVIIKHGYSPEEQYQSKAEQGSYTDVYAIGATLYRMITGQTPPDALERRASFERKKKDMLAPPSKYCKLGINEETAILNALNIRIEDRTPDISTFIYELTTDKTVKLRHGGIKRIDLLRWPLWAKIGIPAALLVVAVLSVLLATGVIGFLPSDIGNKPFPEGMSRVPSVINDNLDNAEQRLADVQLSYSIIGKEYSSEIAVNFVLNQDIKAGSIVEINTTLNIIVSGGVEADNTVSDEQGRFSLADVQFRAKDEAIRLLREQGMVVSITEEYNDSVAWGVVVSQSLAAGMLLSPGAEVEIVVSLGSRPFEMPGVVGMAEAEAKAVLESKKLTVNVTYENSDTASGLVIRQSPEAGTLVTPGTWVEVVVSLGKTGTTYVVKEDDTIWSIAQYFYGNGALYPRIVEANHLGENATTRVGMVLIIPDPGVSTPTVAPTISSTPTSKPKPIPSPTTVPTAIPTPTKTVTPTTSVSNNETRGNTTGNIVNSGYVAIQGDRIYYRNTSDYGRLYTMKTDGSDKQKLSGEDFYIEYINVVGEWVYYNSQGGPIYKICTDGTGRAKLNDDSSSYITVISNWIYYCNGSDGGKLYTMKTDGSDRKKLNDDSSSYINVVGDWAYYSNGSDDRKLYAIKIDGSGRQKLNDDGWANYINVVGNRIYYSLGDAGGILYSIKIDGSDKQMLDSNWSSDNINVVGNQIYYSSWGDNDDRIYTLKTDGSNRYKLSDDETNLINVAGDRIYYINLNDGWKLYSMKTDGSDCRPVD